MSGTPRLGYHTKDGARVPSVTTIIGHRKEADGLVHWAWKLGIDGKDYRSERDSAASAGTMAHDAIEAYVKKEPFAFEGDMEIVQKAKTSFDAFTTWLEQTSIRITHTETRLVSEKYRYGGTIDAPMILNNARCLGDWKTSNSIHAEYLIQLAAYGKLWEENFPDDPIVGGYHLLRISKDDGSYHHHFFSQLDKAWEAFLLMRELYDLDKDLKKQAR